MTVLVSMRPEYFPAFFAVATQVYASENTIAGRWGASEALELARAETERMLPQGVQTPEQQLLEIRESAEDETVGFLWFTKMKRGTSTTAFIVQIYVEPAARGKGHARAAMSAVESFARDQGLSAVVLHVFAHNTEAQALYKSAGFSVASLNMHKAISTGGA
jgi:ribosomal protein S18 acetylase RimI-like enzyme